MTTSLLPPNATRFERAMEVATARVGDVDHPVATLLDPATIAPELLPWLAWAFSVDRWEPDWPVARKRDAVADAIPAHRRKGTPASVEAVLADFDDLLHLAEWFDLPGARPHTFEVRLPIDGRGGARTTAAFAEAILADVARVKPARSHGTLVQMLAAGGTIGVQAAARLAGVARAEIRFTVDDTLPWDRLLQTEDGEPMRSDDGSFLEHQA